jgi:8-oxo-dGTP pyrophosphatase MutT (NUDIX family)
MNSRSSLSIQFHVVTRPERRNCVETPCLPRFSEISIQRATNGSKSNHLLKHANPWITTSSRIAYENRWIRVREDQVIRPDGQPGLYGVVEVPPSVGIVAINQKDYIVLVGQWRYTLGRYLWEIPRGGSDGDSDLLAVAQRELAEEAGIQAEHWEPIGVVDVNSGITSDVQQLFLATGLSASRATHFDPEEKIDVAWHPFKHAVEMVMNGEITEVCSAAAILKVARLREH